MTNLMTRQEQGGEGNFKFPSFSSAGYRLFQRWYDIEGKGAENASECVRCMIRALSKKYACKSRRRSIPWTVNHIAKPKPGGMSPKYPFPDPSAVLCLTSYLWGRCNRQFTSCAAFHITAASSMLSNAKILCVGVVRKTVSPLQHLTPSTREDDCGQHCVVSIHYTPKSENEIYRRYHLGLSSRKQVIGVKRARKIPHFEGFGPNARKC